MIDAPSLFPFIHSYTLSVVYVCFPFQLINSLFLHHLSSSQYYVKTLWRLQNEQIERWNRHIIVRTLQSTHICPHHLIIIVFMSRPFECKNKYLVYLETTLEFKHIYISIIYIIYICVLFYWKEPGTPGFIIGGPRTIWWTNCADEEGCILWYWCCTIVMAGCCCWWCCCDDCWL